MYTYIYRRVRLYAHEGAELTRNLPHRDEGGSGVVLHPCKGGHRIVARNGSADLTTKGVENAAARGVFDDELDQGRGRLGWLRRGRWQGAGGHPLGRRGLAGTGPAWPRSGAKGPERARG